jgi:alpha-mannosidase
MGHQFGPTPSLDKAQRYYMDQGQHFFKIRLIPHGGSWQKGNVQRKAMELNFPPVFIHGGMHKGIMSAGGSRLEVCPSNVLALAVKPADKGKGTVVRLWESSGIKSKAEIRLLSGKNGRLVKAVVALNKFQLKTVILEEKGGKLSVTETNALEEKMVRGKR